MKRSMAKGVAVILLSISITVSGLHPVRAEGTGSGNSPGAGDSVENGTVSGNVSGGKAAEGGSDAAGTDDSGEPGGGTAGTDAEDTQPGEAGTEGFREDGGSVSGGDGATAAEDSAGTEGSGGRQEAGAGNTEAGAGADAGSSVDSRLGLDAGGPDNESEESGGNRESEAGTGDADAGANVDAGANNEGIGLHDLTVYPDDRLAQWDMGNSSGKYGNSSDACAAFSDNTDPLELGHGATAAFIATVPAEVVLTDDVENNRIIGCIPVTVKYLQPPQNLSLYLDDSSYVMQEKQSGRTLALEGWLEDGPWEDSEYDGFRSSLWLSGERLAGDWEGTVRLVFSTHD